MLEDPAWTINFRMLIRWVAPDSLIKRERQGERDRDRVGEEEREFVPGEREEGSLLASEDRPCPLSLTPNTVELIPVHGALSPRGGPVQDPVLIAPPHACCSQEDTAEGFLL